MSNTYGGDPLSGRIDLQHLLYGLGGFADEAQRDPSLLDFFVPFGGEGEGHDMNDVMVMRRLYRTPAGRVFPQSSIKPPRNYNPNTGDGPGTFNPRLLPAILDFLRRDWDAR